jgi:RNA polymerase sigma-70 factor (ECF subfamily)
MDDAVATTALGDRVERSYREQAERLWRSLVLFSADADVASEAVAEAFAQALRRGDAIRDIDAWVWRAGFRIASGLLARRRDDPRGELTEAADLAVEMPESTVDLVRAMRKLSPRQRGAVVLHHYAGYSNKETARILGTTAAAVGVHLDRARRRLRTLLEDTDA